MRDRRSHSPNACQRNIAFGRVKLNDRGFILTGRDVPAARAFDLGQRQRAAVV